MEKVDTYPLVTVVIPTYNRSVLLQKAIASVLNQTYSNLELIIVDDGSTDDTIDELCSVKDKRLRIIQLEHSGHLGKLRNAGARSGKGEWIAFLDSDDQWLPDKLELQLAHIRSTNRRWCYSNFDLVTAEGTKIQSKAGVYQPHSGWITAEILANEATVIIDTIMVERKLFEEVNGLSEDPRLCFRGDYEFAIRLSMQAPVLAIPEVLVKVLEHTDRSTNAITDAYERSAVPYILFIEQQKDDHLLRIARKKKAYLLSEAAVQRSAKGDRRKAAQQLAISFRNDHWRHWASAGWRALKACF